MAETKVMPREEAFRFVARIGVVALIGGPLPTWPSVYGHMRTNDLADAMHDFNRRLAEHLDKIPRENLV